MGPIDLHDASPHYTEYIRLRPMANVISDKNIAQGIVRVGKQGCRYREFENSMASMAWEVWRNIFIYFINFANGQGRD